MDPTDGVRRTFATSLYVGKKTLRHWPWIAAGFVVAFGAAATYAALRAERYRSETLVQVSPAILTDFVPGAQPSADDVRRRIHDLTLSRTQLERVIDELHPYPGAGQGEPSEVVLARFRNAISIEMHGEDTFLLSYVHEEPAIAQAVTDRLVQLFIEERSQSRTSRVEATARVFREQVAVLLADLGRREDALATFKEEHRADLAALRRPPTVPGSRAPHVSYAPATEDSAELQGLRASRLALLAEMRALQSAAQSSPEIEALRAEITQVQRERTSLLERFTSDYPTVAENTRHLSALQRQLSTAIAQASAGATSARMLALAQRIADLDAQIAHAQRSAKRPARPAAAPSTPALPAPPRMSLAEVEAQLGHLEGELATTRDQHRLTATKLFEAEFALSVESRRAAESVKVIDPANRASVPFGPGREVLLGLGAALGLLLGLLLAFGAGALDTRIFEELDLARAAELPVLVAIPTYGRDA